MKWQIELEINASKSLSKLDRTVRERLRKFLIKLATQDNPRLQGKALTGKYAGLWRYRAGDYRLICNIQDNKVTILVLEFGHRKEIYTQ